ncbi:MAG: YfiR family protein [Alphaproteobacteria bacterium]|nr:YfiR family protein [Alphaproteobacteria bacterium]
MIAASLRGIATAGIALGMIALTAPAAQAQSGEVASVGPASPLETSREYLIKAALLFNFAKFAQWPATRFGNDSAPLRVCVIGADPFGSALTSLAGKTVANRTLAVLRITAAEKAAVCHILFVSASEQPRLDQILDAVGSQPILTVADMDQFTGAGGIVALKAADNRSRLEINVEAAEKAGLKLSSKLLRLSDTVDMQAVDQPESLI